MNLLIDTNVILNIVFKRTGYEEAVLLFRKMKESKETDQNTIPIQFPKLKNIFDNSQNQEYNILCT